MRCKSTRRATDMKTLIKHEGVVVPMMTPVTASGTLDDAAVDRLVEVLLAGKVHGVFMLGTTGEGASVSRPERQRLVNRVVGKVQSKVAVYAGIGDLHPDDVAIGNEYLDAGVDAVVARPPVSMAESDLGSWFRSLLDALNGPLILYNIPMLSKVSVPLDLVGNLLGHPRLVGMKDSENDPERLRELLRRFGNHPSFSVFVGVGKLMEEGLRMGADGIVPSVGNLIPETCHQLWECARREDWSGASQHSARMNAVAALYQAGRDLGGSLSALKGALSLRGVCQKHMCPPLKPVSNGELQVLEAELDRLHVMPGRVRTAQPAPPSQPSSTRTFPTL